MIRFRLILLFVNFACIATVHSVGNSQTSCSVEECRNACIEEVSNLASGQDRGEALQALVRLWPWENIKSDVYELLKDHDPYVKLVACEAILAKEGRKAREVVAAESRRLAFDETVLKCRLDLVRFDVGDTSKNRIIQWANLAIVDDQLEHFSCPMHRTVAGSSGQLCATCGMVFATTKPDYEKLDDAWYQAQFLALKKLTRNEPEVVIYETKKILISNYAKQWRKAAAILLARTAPSQGLPHVRIFLGEHQKVPDQDVLQFVAEEMPSPFEDELLSWALDDGASPETRLQSAFGLASLGKEGFAESISEFLNSRYDDVVRTLAIERIGELGDPEEIGRLGELLDTELRVFAAASIQQLLSSPKR